MTTFEELKAEFKDSPFLALVDEAKRTLKANRLDLGRDGRRVCREVAAVEVASKGARHKKLAANQVAFLGECLWRHLLRERWVASVEQYFSSV